MRNIIAHEYGRVDNILVWQAVTGKVPRLAARLALLLDETAASE